jgi:hypothetical protein
MTGCRDREEGKRGKGEGGRGKGRRLGERMEFNRGNSRGQSRG